MNERQRKIARYRQNQPLKELARKADKACRYKQKMWTVEELEAAHAYAIDTCITLGWDTAED